MMNRFVAASLVGLALAGCVAAPTVTQAQLDEAQRTGICCVHHVAMKPKICGLRFGFIVAPGRGDRTTERSRFPFAQRLGYGGEDLLSLGKAIEFLVCADCTAAKASWVRQHPQDPWADWWKEDLAEWKPPVMQGR